MHLIKQWRKIKKIFNKDLLNNKDKLDYVSKKNNISIDSLKNIFAKQP